MLARGDEWYSNREVVRALGLSSKRALLSTGTTFSKQIREFDAGIAGRHYLLPSNEVSSSNGGTQRVFHRRAVITAAMRTDTINAAAFRDWLADWAAGEAFNG